MEAFLAGHKAVLGMGSAAFSGVLKVAAPVLSAGAAIGLPLLNTLRSGAAAQNEVFRSLEWTVMKIPGSDEFVETYFNQGLALQDFTTAKYVATFFMAYGIMAVVPWLPRGAARSLWCFITGLLMTQFVFGVAYLHIALTTVGSYGILALGQSVPALRQWAHLLSGLAVFGYLCLRHLTRSNVNASSVDDSIMQMVLTVKLYTLSFNLYDGTADAKRIDAVLAKSKDDPTKRGEVNMLKDRKTRAITALPSLLDVLGYAFNPCTVMAGPAFEFGMYADGINREGLPENAPRALAVVVKFVLGLITLAVSALFKNVISVDGIFSHLTAVNAGAPAPSALYRFAYMYVAFVLIRGQYYGVWKLSEGAAVLGGFGLRAPALAKNAVSVFAEVEWLVGPANLRYILSFLGSSYETTLSSGLGVKLSGSADAPDWEGASNVTPFTVETRKEAGQSVRTWNLHVQSWLDRYINRRTPRAYSKWLTFLASAFWHGFYPGYYLGFMTVPLILDSSAAFFDALVPVGAALGVNGLFTPARTPWYLLVCAMQWLCVTAAWSYTLLPFCLLDVSRGLDAWRSFGWAGHLIPVAMILVTPLIAALFPKPRAAKTIKVDTEPKAVAKGVDEDATSPKAVSGGSTPKGKVTQRKLA